MAGGCARSTGPKDPEGNPRCQARRSAVRLSGSLVDCSGDLWSIKSQAPSSKLQRTSQRPTPSFAPLGWAFAWKLDVGNALELGIWSLGIDTLLMTRTVHQNL